MFHDNNEDEEKARAVSQDLPRPLLLEYKQLMPSHPRLGLEGPRH